MFINKLIVNYIRNLNLHYFILYFQNLLLIGLISKHELTN